LRAGVATKQEIDVATAKPKTPKPSSPVMAQEAVTPKTVILEAIEPIRNDGVDVAPGETFEASQGAAKALLASGAATKQKS